MRIDARIPVRLNPAPPPDADEAVLQEGLDFGLAAAHPVGCACCVGRAPLALALVALFQKRARGDVGFFRRVRVVADPATAGSHEAAIRTDPLLTTRYRLGE